MHFPPPNRYPFINSCCCLWLVLLSVHFLCVCVCLSSESVWGEESSVFYVFNVTTHNHFSTFSVFKHQMKVKQTHKHRSFNQNLPSTFDALLSHRIKIINGKFVGSVCMSFEFCSCSPKNQIEPMLISMYTKWVCVCLSPSMYIYIYCRCAYVIWSTHCHKM